MTTSSFPSVILALDAALNPPPKNFPFATTAIVTLLVIFLPPSIMMSHSLLSYVGNVEIIPATVERNLLFILPLTLLDLEIISAPTPISAAFSTILLRVLAGLLLSAIVTPITSIFRFLIFCILLKELIP